MPFDPSMMNSTGHPIVTQNVNNNHGASPPKKPRLASTRPPAQLHANHAQLYAMTMPRSPTYNPGPQQTLLDPAVLTPSHPQQQQQQQQQRQHHQIPTHPMHVTQPPPHNPADHPPPHLLVNQSHTPQTSSDPNSANSNNNNNNGMATPNSNTMPNMTPAQAQAQAQQMHHANPTSNPLQHQNQIIHPQPQHHAQQLQQRHSQQQHMPTPSHTLPSNPHTPVNGPSDTYMHSPAPTPSLAAEVQYAGLSDSQRRTQAILQLQQESEMRDEDMVEVMAEFENNIAAADTYLAIKKDVLRRMYLGTIVQRRRQNG